MEIVNVLAVDCDDGMEHEGFRIRGAQIGPRLGAELIGGSVYEVDPGKKLWPYHLHHANEEWLVVLRGRLRCARPKESASWSKVTSPAFRAVPRVHIWCGTRPRSA